MRRLTYQKHRGCHYSICIVCGQRKGEPIPDQASLEYERNPGNPMMALCASCNHGVGQGQLRLGPLTDKPHRYREDLEREPERSLSYSALNGDWGEWARLARRFADHVRGDDRDDLMHDIMVRLVEVAREYQETGKTLTEGGMVRVAAYTRRRYYHEKQRWAKVSQVSLNTEVEDDNGMQTEMINVLADDRAIDLEAWMDAKTWLLGCPLRLAQIAYKRVNGIPLELADRKYLCKWWRREQKRLLEG